MGGFGYVDNGAGNLVDGRRTVRPFELSRSMLRVIVGVVTGPYIMGTQTMRLYLGLLANDFCGNSREEEEDKPALHLLGTCPALCQR